MGLLKAVNLLLNKQNSADSTILTAPINSYWDFELARITSNLVKTALKQHITTWLQHL